MRAVSNVVTLLDILQGVRTELKGILPSQRSIALRAFLSLLDDPFYKAISEICKNVSCKSKFGNNEKMCIKKDGCSKMIRILDFSVFR